MSEGCPTPDFRGAGMPESPPGGPTGFDLDRSDMPNTVEELQEEVQMLRTEVHRLEEQLQAYASRAPSLERRSTSQLGDGTTVNISPDELASMRSVFDVLDDNNSGTISVTELQVRRSRTVVPVPLNETHVVRMKRYHMYSGMSNPPVGSFFQRLHAKMGEPLTQEEAETALSEISGGEDIEIKFEDFVKFWQGNRMKRDDATDTETRAAWRHQYAARFQLVMGRVSSPDVRRVVTRSVGEIPSLEYRLEFRYRDMDGSDRKISPWHDIPIKNPDGTLNFICEIPKWSRRKFEIATGEPFNPIKQDTKNGVLREYDWGDMMFNYGAFPQTWEDPKHFAPETNAIGDNDPLDCIEIGVRRLETGEIASVKPLGVFALIDSDETDWKVLVLNVNDPMADVLHDLDDIREHLPGMLDAIHHWLRMYKSPQGIINRFGFDGEPRGREFAARVIEENHDFWKALVTERGHAATV